MVDRVTIPLTAMPAPPRSAAATLNSSRRPGHTHREPYHWPGSIGHSEVLTGIIMMMMMMMMNR